MWKKLFKRDRLDKVDYINEGNELMARGQFNQAITSFQLAMRGGTQDPLVLQQIAICYTRMGATGQARETYQSVLETDPDAPGAHYGLAFLLLRSERPEKAITHLETFLAHAPKIPEAVEHINHARTTLAELRGEGTGDDAGG